MTLAVFLRCFAIAASAMLAACAATQPPAPVQARLPAEAAAVPPPIAVVPAAAMPAPPPVYAAPDYTTLDGHSSYTTPVPVEPVDVQEMGPVISE